MQYPKFVDRKQIHMESDEILEIKVNALLAAMTREEKLNLCHGHSNPEGQQVANAGYNPGIPRLGVPEIRMYDGPAGVTSVYDTTGLPVQEMLAASWDRELAYQYGKVEGSENTAISGNTQLGSQFDVARIPQFSRVKDMPGEDPFLTSALAVPETRGIQDAGAVATLKHFGPASVNSGMPVAASQEIDEQTLHELVFPPFEAAVKDGHAGAVMCCYNRLNDSYVSANIYAQKTVLRDMWNFKGYVMSDWGANHSLTTMKGMDMEMPYGAYNSNARIRLGIEKGRMSWEDVEAAARHVLYGFGQAGYLSLVQLDENGAVQVEEGRTEPIHMPDCYQAAAADGLLEKNAEICLQVAREGAVLLKNENHTLPLTEKDWTGDSSVVMIGLGAVSLLAGSGQERSYGTISRMVSPAAALQKLAGPDAQITAEIGIEYFGEPIPAACLYQDAACTRHGLVRTYGVTEDESDSPVLPGFSDPDDAASTFTGGAGKEFKGVAASDDEEDSIPIVIPWTNSLAMDMAGHATGSFCCTDACAEFTCGTVNGGPVRTWKNAEGGTAFEKGSAYTWNGFLRVPESGTYTLLLQAIGGNSSFQIQLDSTWITIGTTELRESAQWPWGSLTCTPEGMEVHGGRLDLSAEQVYPIRLRANASIAQKDLQLRLSWITPDQPAQTRARALAAAAKAGKVLFFLSEDYTHPEAGAGGFTGMQPGLPSMEIPVPQMELLRDVKSLMRPEAKLIVVHNQGQLYALGEADAMADAVLNIWAPGQEGGQATAELLTGAVNPSGKLALTIPARDCDTLASDTPAHRVNRYEGHYVEGRKVIDFDEGIFTGYRWYDQTGVQPLYAFGHGLSYTEFRYSDLDIRGQSVTFTVTNTGSVSGSEIAQVYLGAAETVPARIQMAQKQLCAFARLENMQPGEARTVTVSIPDRSLCYWDPQLELQSRADGTEDKWVRTAGSRRVYVGPASDTLPLCADAVF